MIRITVVSDGKGRIHHLDSEGHARADDASGSLVCGIVSHALRSFGRTVAVHGGIPVRGGTSGPGRFRMEIGDIPSSADEWYRGVCDVLIQGLKDIREDDPGQVDMNIINSEQETRNGS